MSAAPALLRLSWTQPEDLAAHALAAARLDGLDVSALEAELTAAGGSLDAPVNGATPVPASRELREVAARITDAATAMPRPSALHEREPDRWEAMGLHPAPIAVRAGLSERLRGAWLGRAVGCLIGKPVEKIPREGIRAIAQSTGRWPLRGYFTEQGLDREVAERWPWIRRSRPTSLDGVIDGMPEDDDLNFAVLALVAQERARAAGAAVTTEGVAQLWLEQLPAGRVFTAERIAYRNLLAGDEPAVAAERGNPFVDWIGAMIRTDAYGWAHPGDLGTAARLAVADARLTHRRAGVHGAAFMAGAAAAAVAGATIGDAVAAGLQCVPEQSRLADAVRLGRDIAASDLDDEAALDELHRAYGHLHWVHVLNNAALLAFAALRGHDDFARGVGLAVAGGWDTDSVGASVGSLLGAAGGVPQELAAPIRGVYRTTLAGFDGIAFDELAARTLALTEEAA
ncbi:ADP-ribosylglycohydrolase family protein [Agrococcus sp. BE272]|uniref:ADP-ribosylglycohydrolase family protein n=1 Tax=Agrococcus sp. BE272 TaxID=2817727 RepID=UPI00285A7D5E|nr:ADP-ribosylglycohydrolase family protein [Agrococcus sp. BE272]MDR7234838.1 ADP-ribosylglycohydrolase [Agrococcus sp. BE272]